jgi:hypothetical protein
VFTVEEPTVTQILTCKRVRVNGFVPTHEP